ncbi:MAG: D-alanine--D-alanine ligase [Planctomycetaceae bacterium]|nr:D-alanine--D-alanine ligase [Planctomycetaceae bacterium]
MLADMNSLRICLLTTQDLDADPFPEDDWPCDPRPFLPEADWQVATLEGKEESVREVEKLIASNRFDLFFNLCDGAADQDIPGIEVVEALEKAEVPFAGASSNFYEPTRIRMKEACTAVGIATPAYVMASTPEEVERAVETLRFPLFVKHYSSYASVDISRRSRVRTPEGLRIQAKKIISRHGTALIEEFIEGIECTVLIAENPEDPLKPIAYTPVQYQFPKGEDFKHEKLKWVDYEGLATIPVADQILAERLKEECSRFFLELEASSFARCDVRVSRDGTPYILEINANCGIYYPPADYGSADLCLTHDPAGHAGFTRNLVKAALARHARATSVTKSPTDSCDGQAEATRPLVSNDTPTEPTRPLESNDTPTEPARPLESNGTPTESTRPSESNGTPAESSVSDG